MHKEVFNSIIEKLSDLRLAVARTVVDSGNALEQLSIEDVRRRCNRARELKADFDRVLTTDLYHIIGMGNMSAAQQVQFCKSIKQLLVYRSRLQALASYTLPGKSTFSGEATYKSKTFDLSLSAENKLEGTV